MHLMQSNLRNQLHRMKSFPQVRNRIQIWFE
jgi:hypothetical protein